MNILIVYAHPEPKSMNGAMFNTAITALEAAGHQVKTSDLYDMEFNATSDRTNFTSTHNHHFYKQQLEELHASSVNGFAPNIAAEQEKVAWCDLMIWQFPLWWFSVPAIMKGWVDRVFAMGRTYGQGHTYETGIFRGKKAMLSLTTGGGEEDYISNGVNGALDNMLKPLHHGIFQFTGFSVLSPHVVYSPARRTPEYRSKELSNWASRLNTVFEEAPIHITGY